VALNQNLDLLHVHYAIPHSVSAYLAKEMVRPHRLPVITTLHGTDITLVGNDRSYLPITRFSIEKSDGVTAVSVYLRDLTYREFDLSRPIEMIPNFVNCDVFRRSEDEGLKRKLAPQGERILVHVSNFRPVKRVMDVIEIFDRVHQRVPSRLIMVGDGPERSNAEWLVRNKRLGCQVTFLGKQDSISEILSISDLMLLPSETESFGLVALEAMACEVPVVASSVGGIPEVIRHEADGFLAPVGDVDGMAARAVEILSDDAKRATMGANSRQHAQNAFSSHRIIARYEDYYEQVVREVQGAPGA
jgi:N-acetyl-alpha-D-glucosaminyl L-malate synthase BshA